VKNDQIDGFYGRFVKLSFARNVTDKTEVPDRFSSVKLCKVPSSGAGESSLFALLHKRPDETISPYCYEMTFVARKNGRAVLRGDDGEIASNNQDYWIENIPDKQRSLLLSIVRKVKDAVHD
jgi:hypothetical protein